MKLEPLTPLPKAGRHLTRRRCGQEDPIRDWQQCRHIAIGLMPSDVARYLRVRGDRAVCAMHRRLYEQAIEEARHA